MKSDLMVSIGKYLLFIEQYFILDNEDRRNVASAATDYRSRYTKYNDIEKNIINFKETCAVPDGSESKKLIDFYNSIILGGGCDYLLGVLLAKERFYLVMENRANGKEVSKGTIEDIINEVNETREDLINIQEVLKSSYKDLQAY